MGIIIITIIDYYKQNTPPQGFQTRESELCLSPSPHFLITELELGNKNLPAPVP